jgi:hypothetical protein
MKWLLIFLTTSGFPSIEFDTHLKCDVAIQEIRKEFARYKNRPPMMVCVYAKGGEPNEQQKGMP